MDIKQLQYFVVSVDMGSFHAAAETLITTQPNVSKVVKALEEELNMQLLVRKRSGVTITADGERIYRYAIGILKNFKAIREIREENGVDKLSISTTPSNKLSTVIAEFYNEHQDNLIQMNIWEGSVEDIIVRVHKRMSELGFLYISNRNLSTFNRQIKSKNIEYFELLRTPLYLFVGKNNPLYEETHISANKIRKIKLIQHNEELYSLYNHLGHLKEDVMYSDDITSLTTTNSDYFVIQLLKNTNYCSMGSSFDKEKYEEYGIHSIPIDSCEESISFGYIKRSKSRLSGLEKEFLEYLDEKVARK